MIELFYSQSLRFLKTFGLVIFLIACLMSTPVLASVTDLTGVWKSGIGGTYYIQQIGDTIWWYGEAKDTNPSWSTVATGTIDGSTINLNWADVPKGTG